MFKQSQQFWLLCSIVATILFMFFWIFAEYQLGKAQDTISQLNSEISALNMDISTLNEDKLAQDGKLNSLSDSVNAQAGNLEFNDNILKALQEALSSLKLRYQNLSSDYDKTLQRFQKSELQKAQALLQLQLAQIQIADTNEWLTTFDLTTVLPDIDSGFPIFSGVQEQLSNGAIRVQIPVDLWFKNGAELSHRAIKEITLAADYLQTKAYYLSVQGHSDNTPITSDLANEYKDNLDLSTERAASVVRELIALGIDKKQLRVVGYGDNLPLNSDSDFDSRMENRRIELMFYPAIVAKTTPE